MRRVAHFQDDYVCAGLERDAGVISRQERESMVTSKLLLLVNRAMARPLDVTPRKLDMLVFKPQHLRHRHANIRRCDAEQTVRVAYIETEC